MIDNLEQEIENTKKLSNNFDKFIDNVENNKTYKDLDRDLKKLFKNENEYKKQI